MKEGMNLMQRSRFLVAGILLGSALLWLAGCADGIPRRMEEDYGRSVNYNRLDMMATPPDKVDTRPPVGMGPQAAVNTQESYEKSFKKKAEPQTLKLLLR